MGKTTVTLGLLRLLMREGITVQPFKVGPDYIDPQFHTLACGVRSINLDLFMMKEEEVLHSVVASVAEVQCIEGVMGLFDGSCKAEGSTAALAKKLRTKVVLVLDAQAVAYSVAAWIQGFRDFDPAVQLAGVIFNLVGSVRHYELLAEACADTGVPCLGYVEKHADLHIPSRHLGLHTEDVPQFDCTIEAIATRMARTVDWRRLLQVQAESLAVVTPLAASSTRHWTFAVAQDEAFSFTYQQNLQAMEQLGEVRYFSPLRDSALPKADWVYLPGGYPECHACALAANTSMRASIRGYVGDGGALYAECGGMMYLGEALITEQAERYPMAQVYNFTTMAQQGLHCGYRVVQIDGHVFYGHEFHYSTVETQMTGTAAVVLNARGVAVPTLIFKHQHTMASYIHVYFGNVATLLALINITRS